MPLDYEDFVRCSNCGCPDFREETVVTVPKILKPRVNKAAELEAADRHVRYMCIECNLELDR